MAKNNNNHWIQTFGKAQGSQVLKEIRDYARFEDKTEPLQVLHGRRQMFEYILNKIKTASGKKEIYAGIIYEMELL